MSEKPIKTLPDTFTLLASGGDTRIVPDAVSGLTMYGCGPGPDPDLVALGSSTASSISEKGWAAASALRQICLEQVQYESKTSVYTMQMERLRSELLGLCGFASSDGVNAVFAASGTDLHLLATQWLRPQRTIMITETETGSGVPAAVQGQHFNRQSACGSKVAMGALVGDWQGDLFMMAARQADGSLRDAAITDAECVAMVSKAAEAGQQVLLILTDVSKTGLIFPRIETVLALKQRWPEQVNVLVDACQFRLSAPTIRAYLSHHCMVALTGSKFIAGPTFCGTLLIPPSVSMRYRDMALAPGAHTYSNAADWPSDWLAGRSLPVATNFGLLLRWEAAMTELRTFFTIPEHRITKFLQYFAAAVKARLAHDTCFESLPVAMLSRRALRHKVSWDTEQTIFPFVIYKPDDSAGRRPLLRDEIKHVYETLRHPGAGTETRRFQLGQPVPCGEHDGVAVSALRLCVSVPMIVAACQGDSAGADGAIADAMAALDQIKKIILSNDL